MMFLRDVPFYLWISNIRLFPIICDMWYEKKITGIDERRKLIMLNT